MSISVLWCEPAEIASLRDAYRTEMHCQIIHDSIHYRPGWSTEYILEMNGAVAGYGSVATGGPWTKVNALYEFYVKEPFRRNVFDLFSSFAARCHAGTIETQTNDVMLSIMLHTFAQNVRAEAILFEDRFQTELKPEGAGFRSITDEDVVTLRSLELDDSARWVVTKSGEIVGAGGILYHYNRPYGDIYMKVAEPYWRQGLGSYLVQELKAACRAGGHVPAARCNVGNIASRRTLQKAGLVPCGNLIVGDLPQG
jgi:RimJ/RimL family protein N-acetyltransferase